MSLGSVNDWLESDMLDGYDIAMVNREEEYHYCIVSVTENGINIKVLKVDNGVNFHGV